MSSYRPSRERGRKTLRGYVLPTRQEENYLRRLRWRRLLIGLGLLAVLVGAFFMYRSPLLRVQEVQVVGAQLVDPLEVQALADLQGQSIFRLPLDSVEHRIAALPLIKGVKASRLFPNKVRIQVVERTPWGFWQIGDKAYVIDAEGVVLGGIVPEENAATIVDITGRDPLLAGDRVEPETVVLAQRLAQAVLEIFQLGIARFEYNVATGLTVVTSADYRVVIGDSQNLEYKLAVWQALEEKLGRQQMGSHVLDLRFGNRPSFR